MANTSPLLRHQSVTVRDAARRRARRGAAPLAAPLWLLMCAHTHTCGCRDAAPLAAQKHSRLSLSISLYIYHLSNLNLTCRMRPRHGSTIAQDASTAADRAARSGRPPFGNSAQHRSQWRRSIFKGSTRSSMHRVSECDMRCMHSSFPSTPIAAAGRPLAQCMWRNGPPLRTTHRPHQRSPRPAGCLNLRNTRPVSEMRVPAGASPAAASAGWPSQLAGAPNPPPKGDAAAPNKLVAAGAPNMAVPAPPKSGAAEAPVAPNAGAAAGALAPHVKVGLPVLEPAASKAKLAAGRAAGCPPRRGADEHCEGKPNCATSGRRGTGVRPTGDSATGKGELTRAREQRGCSTHR
jgi:hypothetical protein